MRTHARYHYDAETKGAKRLFTSAPTSPTMPVQRRLKRRAHYARSRPQPQSLNGQGSLQSKDNPHAARAKGSKNRPSKGAINTLM
jgi:hypothetical protein